MVKETTPEEKATEEKRANRPEGVLIIKGSKEKADAARKDGWIETTFFIESHGNDKETVATALKNTLLKDLKNEKGVIVRELKFHPVVEQTKLYAGFVECNILTRDPQVFMYLTLRYGPSAVEVLHPDTITVTASELQNMAADASGAVQALISQILEKMAPEERDKAFRKGLDLDG
jgi:hypothetical protein